MSRLTALLASACVASLVGGGAFAASTRSSLRSAIATDSSGAALPASGTQRFLQLTQDRSGRPGTTKASAMKGGKGGKGGKANGQGAGRGQDGSNGQPSCGTSPTTPAGWCLTPAGTQYDVIRFPIGLAVDPSSGDAIVSSDNGGTQAIAVIDPAKPDPHLATTFAPGANLFLGLAPTTGGTLYASGGNADRVFRYRLAGGAAIPQDDTQAAPVPTHNATNGLQSRGGKVQAAPVGDGIHVSGYPGQLVSDEAHHLVFAGGTLSEPSGTGSEACPGGVAACARVTVIDTTKENSGTDPAVKRIAVGADTYGLALDSAHHQLFVANWGDQASRGNGTGTVSVLPVDAETGMPGAESVAIPVGHHPEAVALSKDQSHLYVTDTNDDTVSVIDTVSHAVVGTLDVGIPGHLTGTQPDALAVAPDGSTLFVALAGLNAVQVVALNPSGAVAHGAPVRYLPTGWYPSALAAVPGPNGQGTRLWVANAKGIGFGPGVNGTVFAEGTTTGGTVSRIDLPANPSAELAQGTRAVIANAGVQADPDPCDGQPSEVLCPGGSPPSATNPSPIQHVVYIVLENKTFDSYFGDINQTGSKAYDADPKFLLFGQPVTPNQHALATDGLGVLGDNFYSDAEVSVTGHSYTAGARATDHNEKTWPADYDQGVRGARGSTDPLRPSVGSPSQNAAINRVESTLYDPQGGFIFERFKAKGAVDPATKAQDPAAHPLSMAIYGEHSTTAVGPEFHATGNVPWKDGDINYFDSCRSDLFLTGKTGAARTPNSDQTRDCAGHTLDKQFTLSEWEAQYAKTGADVMPNLIYMSLPVNHTVGTNLGSPTPQSMVADNDYAIGRIVEGLSKSPFWSSTAIVLVQDDTQATGDHVSPLRDPLEVIGPWAATKPDHQRGSMGSLLRTIELLFDVDPVGINDRLAAPLHGAFVSGLGDKHSECNAGTQPGPDGSYAKACYTAQRPLVPFAVNAPGAPGQAASMAMDWSKVDRIDMATLNAIWVATQHHTPFKKPATSAHTVDKDGGPGTRRLATGRLGSRRRGAGGPRSRPGRRRPAEMTTVHPVEGS